MELSKLELKMIEGIYQRDYDDNFDKKIATSELDLIESDSKERGHEAGFYVLRLYDLNYIDFDNKKAALITGGAKSDKYNNNIITI